MTPILLALALAATPQPKPPIPTSVAFTQGVVTRALPITSASCVNYTASPLNGAHGQIRFRVACTNGQVQAPWVQFDVDAGPIYSAYLWPAPTCGQKPAVASQHAACTPPLVGPGWTQTHDWTCSAGVWVALPWTPTDPPAGACQSVAPTWTPAVNVSADPLAPKPAIGTVVAVPHYGTTYNRITNHAQDGSGVSMERNDYSRRQPVNLDGTKLLNANSDEYWFVQDITDPVHPRFIERLNGPAGDSEIQWSATDPDVLFFLDRNGGTVLKQVKVSTNANSVVWDFGPLVRGFWPASSHCWTKSEGSPSADGSRWGLMCEDGNFNPLGFVVLDINAHTAVWHQNNSNRPDHVSISPSGRFFVAGWNGSPGVISYDTTGVLAPRTTNGNAEHSDLGICNGRDFYASLDYSTNQGDIFYTYLDDGVRHVVGYVYGHPNPWFQTNYAIHVSAKAFGKCGFLSSNYGVPPANIVWFDFNAPPNTPYGVGINYSKDRDYWEEVQAAISRDGKSFFYNDTFNGAQDDVDVYRGTMPQ